MLESASQEERLRLEDLSKSTSFETMYSSKLLYNRHEGLYTFRVRDFPESYKVSESYMEYLKDPDFINKFRINRLNIKLWLLATFLFYQLCQWKCRQVEQFDRLKRKE